MTHGEGGEVGITDIPYPTIVLKDYLPLPFYQIFKKRLEKNAIFEAFLTKSCDFHKSRPKIIHYLYPSGF